jgi:CBS domain-containing membrane protein
VILGGAVVRKDLAGRWLRALGPAMARPASGEMLRAALGAGLALAASALLLDAVGGLVASAMRPGLIAPLGASAFLLFAVPNSPLAQPWSALVGNGVSALVAVLVLMLGLNTGMAAGLAVCAAMAAMAALRAMHPPGAAVALATVLIAADGTAVGVDFVAVPVLLDTGLLVLFALGWNRLTGRRYPFRVAASPHGTADAPPQQRLGLSGEDLAALLQRTNQSANIGAEDLGRLLVAAEAEAARRRFGALTCADIMSRDVVTVAADAPLAMVAALFRQHRFKSLPVVDGDGWLEAMVSQTDFVAAWPDAAPLTQRAGAALGRLVGRGPAAVARDVMVPARSVAPNAPVGVLVELLADGAVEAVPVVSSRRLVGIVTRSDFLALLAQRRILPEPPTA